MPGFHPSVAVLPLPFCRCWTANQRSGHCSSAVNGNNGKTFPAIPFSRATATVAVERNYGNGTTERQNGSGSTATEWWKLGIRVDAQK